MTTKEKYNQAKIEKLAEYIKLYHDKGRPIDYEVLVDGFKAVRRTSDPDMFNIFEDFINVDTRSVEVLFYTGNSNNNDKHIFYFGEGEQLNGLDVNAQVKEQLDKEKKDVRIKELEDKNSELQEEVKDLQEEVEELEKEKQELISKQSPLKDVFGEIGSSLVESFIRRNPNVIKGIPGGEALAGLIDGDKKKEGPRGGSEKEEEVSFQSKSNSTLAMNEEEKMAIVFVNQLKSKFTKDEFDQILLILEELSHNKSKIEAVLKDISLQSRNVL
jgi:hypothetical protein